MVPTLESAAPPITATRWFNRFAWGVLAWNILVVLWGAYVRASGSGAGCGNHWPLCNGDVVPRAPRLETIIEFTHRMMSGVALIAVIGLAVWSFYRFPRGHRVRRAANLSVLFLIVEALLGAGLVLFQYVDRNASVGRAFYLSLHLVNTQLLLAALALTAWYSRGRPTPLGRARPLIVATLPIAIVISVAGVVAALGDTLYPSASLAEGMRQDLSTAASFLIRLRMLHPAFAILGAIYFVVVAFKMARFTPLAAYTIILSAAQLLLGAMNLALLAPIWIQITHLLVADLLWLALVLLTVETRESTTTNQQLTTSGSCP
ncbi:MAG: COX15/CtaA family protein [Bryobacteraceae bacterium]|jgi:heme A synthase